jgi:hypothetical protein
MSQPKNLIESDKLSLLYLLKIVRPFAQQVDKRKKPFNCLLLRDTGRFYADLFDLPF